MTPALCVLVSYFFGSSDPQFLWVSHWNDSSTYLYQSE